MSSVHILLLRPEDDTHRPISRQSDHMSLALLRNFSSQELPNSIYKLISMLAGPSQKAQENTSANNKRNASPV